MSDIELVAPRYSHTDRARSVAAVFAASVPPTPKGWSRTTLHGPAGILYSIDDRTDSENVAVLADHSGVSVSVGWNSKAATAEQYSQTALCIELAKADANAFRIWLEAYGTPLATGATS